LSGLRVSLVLLIIFCQKNSACSAHVEDAIPKVYLPPNIQKESKAFTSLLQLVFNVVNIQALMTTESSQRPIHYLPKNLSKRLFITSRII